VHFSLGANLETAVETASTRGKASLRWLNVQPTKVGLAMDCREFIRPIKLAPKLKCTPTAARFAISLILRYT
jgi:hypothetical protein